MNLEEHRLLQEIEHLKKMLQMKNDRIKDLEELCSLFELCTRNLQQKIAFRNDIIMYLGGEPELNNLMLTRTQLQLQTESNYRAN